jgi:hypothetical protein
MISPVKSLLGLEVNQKVICKKMLNDTDEKVMFEKNHYYTINTLDESDNTVWVVYGNDEENEGAWLHLSGDMDIYPKFYKHFYTEQELRKAKLEKIFQQNADSSLNIKKI